MEMHNRNIAIKFIYQNLTEEEKQKWQDKAQASKQNALSPEVVKKIKTQLQSQVPSLIKIENSIVSCQVVGKTYIYEL